jgi:glycosidase
MVWGNAQNEELFKYYQDLIRVRRRYPALGWGNSRVVQADKDTMLYAKDSSDKILIAINLSAEPQKITNPMKPNEILVKTGENDARCEPSGITLAPTGGAIILVE